MAKTKFKIFFLFCLFISISNSYSEESTIGYVDLEYVFENSNVKNQVYARYKSQIESLRTVKKAAEKSLYMFKKNVRELEQVLGYEEYKKEFKSIQKKIEEQEKVIQEAREEYAKWEADLMSSVFDNLISVFQALAEKRNFDIVLSKKTSVIYGKASVDLSQDAVDLINDLNDRLSPTAK